MVKLLLAFGAVVHMCNYVGQSPLDIALDIPNQILVELLVSLDGSECETVQQRHLTFSCRVSSFPKPEKSMSPIQPSEDPANSNHMMDGLASPRQRSQTCSIFTLKDIEEGKAAKSLHDYLKTHINTQLERSESFSGDSEATAIALQQRELARYRQTRQDHTVFEVKGGSRILSLDGGGMRGLIQIEVLRLLEVRTGRKVTDLFDWIVGTSTGGVVALALVYGKCENIWKLLLFGNYAAYATLTY